ncbi:carnitine O-palmitoyltransferase 1, liver isoform [Elysia marginata]|uniref:Carnitine O-palmitoyltransferase 1, liver isoform n=1 Tax=Elysia marginata TaxID=1093978 RepID=A0AAV4EN74_9GAST|nr:carnitine O-palmitoyltransferase 1, liver isoform [Elysia marginata]
MSLSLCLYRVNTASHSVGVYLSTVMFGTVVWVLKWLIIKYNLKLLLTYHNWMYEVRGKMSLKTKLWFMLIRLYGGRKPLLMSYQASLPKMPVPGLKQSVDRYLKSVKHLMTEDKYKEVEKLADDFRKGVGNKLQRYLILKSWWATNYVSDWWEQYVYLRGRDPIMVNSNYYGVDALLVTNTTVQVARAANLIYAILQYRREVDREELNPILINKIVPLCSAQYERQFNTTRIPGVETAQYERQFNTTRIPGVETDTLVHLNDSNHIAVYHKGRYFKVYIRHKHRLLKPCEIEAMLQKIVEDETPPAEGEEHLAALTAGERVPWAKARKEFFSKGRNKASLDAIEKAAFVVALDDEPHDYDPNDPTRLDAYGKAMLHGKCYDRWFDKSFTFVVCSNGRIGFNAEHAWADAPIQAHMWEIVVTMDLVLGYMMINSCLAASHAMT